MSKPRRRLDVSANADPQTLTLTAPVEFAAAAPPKEGEPPPRPRFSIAAYTGAPVEVGNFYHPVILELSGMKAGRTKLPILRDHDPLRIVGMTDQVEIDASGVRLEGMVTGDNSDASEVVSQARNGFEWQASVGANITRREFLEKGQTAQVNGRQVTGPLIIARESLLLETSFVALGADHQTSARVAATHDRGKATNMDAKLATWLEAKGFQPDELDDTQVATLEMAFKAEGGSKPKPRVDDVLAEAKKEQARRERIADLTAQFLADNPGGGPDLIAKVEALATMAIEAKWSDEKYDTELLRASRPAPFAQFNGRVGRKARITDDVIVAAVCQAGRLENHEKQFSDETLQTAHDHFRNGIGLKQIFLMCAESHGHRGSYASDVSVDVQRAAFGMTSPNRVQAAGGFSALDISTILSNTANKFLMEGWNAIDMTPLRIAKVTPVRDFKQITTVSLTGGLEFEQVGNDGEIKHGTLGEQTYTNQADTYAKMLAITRKDIINDDLGALTAVPRRLGRGGALKLNDIFWTEFLVLETDSFFSAGNANLRDGVADMTTAGLANTEAMFLNQTDPDGYPLGVQPRILLVPTALKAAALTLMESQLLIDGTATGTQGATNIWRGRFRVETSPYMSNSAYTGYSAAAWYLLADPMDLPLIEIVALNGRVEPVVESADADFNTLGVQMRGYSDVGVYRQEYRAGVKADGGSS